MPGRTNGRMDLELDRKMMMKKYTVVAAAMAAALALSGCNTVEGFGQDIKKGAGFGIRWLSPIGLVKLDLAKAVGDPTEDSWKIYFGLGGAL